jgi:hydrogenase maturation protease
MTRVLILAYGNPLRGDDGLGWHAAQALAGEIDGETVRVLFCEQLTPDLAETASACRRIIFIDASVSEAPGVVSCRRLKPSSGSPGSFTHEISPEGLLAWTRALFGSTPDASLVSVGAESFEFGQGLSPSVAKSLPALLACVREQVSLPEG